MKRLNHRGSAALLVLSLLLAGLLMLSVLGFDVEGTPKTTRWRLVNDPFASWSLLVFLSAGLALIRFGAERIQCVHALLFVGMLWGLGFASALFWDPWLSAALTWAGLPVLQSARKTLVESKSQEKPAGMTRRERRAAQHKG